MTQSNVYSDADDSTSNITVESDDTDIERNVVSTPYPNSFDESRINASDLNLPGGGGIVPNKASISHISSVALQNSSDITFGNKTLYSGPITVNQYGLEKSTATNYGKSIRIQLFRTKT